MRSVTDNIAKIMVKNIKINNGFTVNVGFIFMLTILMVCINIWWKLQTPSNPTKKTRDKRSH